MSKKHIIESIRFIALSCGISCSKISEATTNYNTKSYSVCLSGQLARIPMLTKKKSFEGYTPKTRGRRIK